MAIKISGHESGDSEFLGTSLKMYLRDYDFRERV